MYIYKDITRTSDKRAMNTRLTYNIQNDIYELLSQLALIYTMNGKKFDENNIKQSIE